MIHLDRADGSGAVHAAELERAAPSVAGTCSALILNALGRKRFDEIVERSVWLGKDAVDWIIGTGVHLLVSDIYESAPVLTGVFDALFAAGVSTVCCPVNLHQLTAPCVRLTVLPARFLSVTQLPCRVVAEQSSTDKENL